MLQVLWLWKLFYKTGLADLTISFYKIRTYLKIGLIFYYEMVQPPWGIFLLFNVTILLLSSLQYNYNRMIYSFKNVTELLVNFIIQTLHQVSTISFRLGLRSSVQDKKTESL